MSRAPLLLSLLVTLAAGTAWACPSCAASAETLRGGETVWLVILTASPLVVGVAVALALRAYGRQGAGR